MPLLQVSQSILKGFFLWLVSTTMIHLLNDSQPAANWNINPAPVAQTNTVMVAVVGVSVSVACVCMCVVSVLVLHASATCATGVHLWAMKSATQHLCQWDYQEEQSLWEKTGKKKNEMLKESESRQIYADFWHYLSCRMGELAQKKMLIVLDWNSPSLQVLRWQLEPQMDHRVSAVQNLLWTLEKKD